MTRNARQAKKARRLRKVARIVRADLRPDDVLVIRADGFDPSLYVECSELQKVLGCNVMFLPASAKLDVVRGALPPLLEGKYPVLKPSVGVPDWSMRPTAMAQGV